MNELAVFESESFGEIRTTTIDNEPWFVAKDVCDILGISNPTMSMDGLEDFERTKLNLGRQGETNVISESGFYTLVLRSRKPIAKPFRLWVTKEVIPQIRKTGGYIPVKEEDSNEAIMAKAYLIATETLKKQSELVNRLQPLAEIAEARIDKKGCFSVTDITKSLGFKRGQITRWARTQGYIHMSLTEVNGVGEKYFKVYSSDGVHNQIGILQDGLDLINAHKVEIKETKVR